MDHETVRDALTCALRPEEARDRATPKPKRFASSSGFNSLGPGLKPGGEAGAIRLEHRPAGHPQRWSRSRLFHRPHRSALRQV